jgi:hypothetical protein
VRTYVPPRERWAEQSPHVTGGKGDAVDATPFLAWIKSTFPGWTYSEISDRLQLHDRRLWEIRKKRRVSLRVVDRAVSAAYGRPDIFLSLYPPDER